MLERLPYLKLAPRRILDAGSGPAREARALMAAYAKAEFIALDHSAAMLRSGRSRLFERKKFVCAELARLPLAPGSIDFVWSNMALHWAEPLGALREFQRVLAADGLLMFSTLGPDSLRELRSAAGPASVHEFIDMHDLGDMLVAAGFSAPVMDMEMLTINYARADLLADLRASGQTNARSDRPRGLRGRRFLEALRARLGRSASFEIVYGHAWKGAPQGKLADGRDVVRFHSASLR